MEIRILEKPDRNIAELMGIWEPSVRHTHNFLREKDIRGLRTFVEDAISSIPLLLGCFEQNLCLGFLGMDGNKIEMLFIAPESRGKGFGRALVDYAVQTKGAKEVDVNEQNLQAIRFYEKMGFVTGSRSEIDDQGKPFPILHMQLS